MSLHSGRVGRRHLYCCSPCTILQWVLLSLVCIFQSSCSSDTPKELETPSNERGPIHVYEGESIQAAIDLVSQAETQRRVIVHEGIYSPEKKAFAFLTLTSQHDGLELIAEGKVTLTALSSVEGSPETPLVNHVIYCGDGLSPETLIQGFSITGARGSVPIDNIPTEDFGLRNHALKRGTFFLLDGGGLKVFGKSAPTIQDIYFYDNETDLCGGAVSIEQQSFKSQGVIFKNCIFENNRCPGTGSAIDVLSGSAARIENCLFVGNIANYGMEQIATNFGLTYHPEHGSGALTVFPGSNVVVKNSTFTKNWNAVDDHGTGSQYENCILWKNSQADGSRPGLPYEFDIGNTSGVTNCCVHGMINDLRGSIDQTKNYFDPPDPEFTEFFFPNSSFYREKNIGYRPILLTDGD